MDLPTLIPKPSPVESVKMKEEGEYKLPNTMRDGFSCVRSQMCKTHPLEESEKKYKSNAENFNFACLRSTQGLHAPLRLMYEKMAVSKVHRHPLLPSSNIMQEALDGTDECIGFEDILNDPSEREELVSPHVLMERHLGLL